jgi:hypothetical protein
MPWELRKKRKQNGSQLPTLGSPGKLGDLLPPQIRDPAASRPAKPPAPPPEGQEYYWVDDAP